MALCKAFLLLAFCLGACNSESFNFEIARRTTDEITSLLDVVSFPGTQVVHAFDLGWLDTNSTSVERETRLLVRALLAAGPLVASMFVEFQDKFVGMISSNEMLITTELISNGSCTISQYPNCLNVATYDAVADPVTNLGTQNTSIIHNTYLPANTTSTWGSVINLSTTQLALQFSFPITLSSSNKTIGTVSTGIALNSLGSFLSNAFGVEDDRVVYVVERRTGKLIASSAVGVATTTKDGVVVQVKAVECSNLLVRETSAFLFGLDNLQNEVLYVNNGYYVQSTPYTAAGIDWLIVVIRPADTNADYIASGSSTYSVLCVIIALCVLVTLLLTVWVVRFRGMRLWKAAQPTAMLLVLFANLMCICTAFTLMGHPTDTLCLGRQWMLSFSVSLTCASFIAKSLRVFLATGANNMFKQNVFRRLTSKHVVLMVALIATLQFLFLSVWTALDRLRVFLKYKSELGVFVGYEVCATDNLVWVTGSICFVAVLVIAGCYLTFVTRNVSELFAESRALMLIFYHGTILGAVLIFVGFLTDVTTKSFLLFVIMALLWFTLTTQFALFFPRMYRQVTLGDFSMWEMKEIMLKNFTKGKNFQAEDRNSGANSSANAAQGSTPAPNAATTNARATFGLIATPQASKSSYNQNRNSGSHSHSRSHNNNNNNNNQNASATLLPNTPNETVVENDSPNNSTEPADCVYVI